MDKDVLWIWKVMSGRGLTKRYEIIYTFLIYILIL